MPRSGPLRTRGRDRRSGCSRRLRLRELTAGELRELGGRVMRLYQRAYEVAGKKEKRAAELLDVCVQFTRRQAEGRNPRKFIRLLLEKLDVLYA